MKTLLQDIPHKNPTQPGKRILLVEDQVGVRETLKLVLKLDGYSVAEATNGREACLMFTPGDYDLIITDYAMPEMKGDELARTIKCLVPSQPVLMLTAYPGEALNKSNPADAVLEKPFEVAALRRNIASLLSRHDEECLPSCGRR
jgi:CheY-like chemotaxis protein